MSRPLPTDMYSTNLVRAPRSVWLYPANTSSEMWNALYGSQQRDGHPGMRRTCEQLHLRVPDCVSIKTLQRIFPCKMVVSGVTIDCHNVGSIVSISSIVIEQCKPLSVILDMKGLSARFCTMLGSWALILWDWCPGMGHANR